MPNSGDLNEQLEFEERIKSMPSDERTIFIAKQTYALTNKFDAIDKKLDSLTGNGINRKAVATTSGITSALIVGIIEGLKTLFTK